MIGLAVTMVRVAAGTQRGAMVLGMDGLPETLTLVLVIAGTLEYAILMRHREERRTNDRLDDLTTRLGQQALMRLHLIDRVRAPRRWGAFGTRFR